MSAPIDFWFDFSCPYAYLGSTQVARVAAQSGREVRLAPFLLGGVFRALEQPQNMSVTLNPPKKQHNRADLVRWATWFNVPLRTPHHHPNRTVTALRTLLACPQDRWPEVMAALFRVYWVDAADISDPQVISGTLDALGLAGTELVAAAGSPEIKAELFTRTDAAIAAGVFGAPAWVVDGQLFWGQDRIEMVIRAARDRWTIDSAYDDFTFDQETT
ncbi:MAG: 2-hydroxychromene-2-carboxylate isomerase [Myxococcales bacterium]|nr:2-hydroxychromene-2-carboxylate isomerase [Myxococcales bacterium]